MRVARAAGSRSTTADSGRCAPQWSLRLTPEDTTTAIKNVLSRSGPAMEPPAYTGGHPSATTHTFAHADTRNGASGLHRRTRESPQGRGRHRRSRNGASGLHRRTLGGVGCVSFWCWVPAMEPPAYTGGHVSPPVSSFTLASSPQWSLRLTPEDTSSPSSSPSPVSVPQWSLRLTPEDTASSSQTQGRCRSRNGASGLHRRTRRRLPRCIPRVRARNGASGLHRRTRDEIDGTRIPIVVPQWSLRLTPEDTKYRSLDARQLYPPQWSLRLTPEDTAPE